jgi:hypothetical protein
MSNICRTRSRMVGIESADREHECKARQRNASGQRCKCL